jgi:two-component system OmpR family response regulator
VHLLVVEDDPRLGRLLRRLLEEDRHVVELATDVRSALELATEIGGFEAIVLDLGLPDGSGLDVARRLRAAGSTVPILVLTARDTVGDRVTGLDAGADDYLVKPFAFEELAARLRALARRAGGPEAIRAGLRVQVGGIALDEARREVTADGRRIELSPREFSLLEYFLRHPGEALTRDRLLDHVWPSGVAVTPNAVDAYVHYLRSKLGSAGGRIRTLRGIGYRLEDSA